MKVRREGAAFGDEIDNVERAVHRFERADAKEHVRGKRDATTATTRERAQQFDK